MSAEPDRLGSEYRIAVVRLATFQAQRTQAGRLLFASVTLLAGQRERPQSSKSVEICPVGKSEGRVYYRRVVLEVRAAIDWYLGLGREATNVTPVPSQEGERIAQDGASIVVPSLVDRPRWPRLGLSLGQDLVASPLEPSQPCPFVGSVPSRVHRRFGEQSGVEGLLSDEPCVAFLRKRVHVDFRKYPEYLSSAVLVAQDPLIKRIDNFFVPQPDGGEKEVIRVVPHRRGNLDGLSVTVFERQAELLTRFETRQLPESGLLMLASNEPLAATGLLVSHESMGPLQVQAANHYLRAVSLGVHVDGPTVQIEAPADDSRRAARTRYAATSTTRVSSATAGTPSMGNVDGRVESASERRRLAAAARRYEQCWLEGGDREAALTFVRARLRQATETILIADPYLSALQVWQLLFASPARCSVTILTSRLAFEAQFLDDSSELDESGRLQGFADALAKLQHHVQTPAKAFVLPGQSPELHDRFLCVDDAVWLFGGSFNGLGKRASLAIKLPEAVDVKSKLQVMLGTAIPFAEHLASRKAALDASK